MPFNLTMITFVSGSPALAGDVNTNFTTLNTGNMSSWSSDGGKITSDGNGHFILSNNIPLRIMDASGTPHDVLYVDAANEVALQMIDNTKRMYFSAAGGTSLMSIDSSGNVRCRGTLTQNTTP